jgi:hypothetical protein
MAINAKELMTKILDRYESAVHELDAFRAVISTLPENQIVYRTIDRLLAQEKYRRARRSKFARLRAEVSSALDRQVAHGMLLALPKDDQNPN